MLVEECVPTLWIRKEKVLVVNGDIVWFPEINQIKLEYTASGLRLNCKEINVHHLLLLNKDVNPSKRPERDMARQSVSVRCLAIIRRSSGGNRTLSSTIPNIFIKSREKRLRSNLSQ